MAPTTRKSIYIIVIKHFSSLKKCLLRTPHSVPLGFVAPWGYIGQVVSLMFWDPHMIENLSHMSFLMSFASLDI